jgi:amino acid transporter
MSQPQVPWWVAVAVVVGIAVCSAALGYNDPAVTFLTPAVKFVLFLVNIGLGAFATALNIRGADTKQSTPPAP